MPDEQKTLWYKENVSLCWHLGSCKAFLVHHSFFATKTCDEFHRAGTNELSR